MGSDPQTQTQLVYANATRVQGGAFDVALDFGYQPGDATPGWICRVAMSWEHAQAVVDLLSKAIESYESQVGPLPSVEKLRVEESSS